MTKRKSKLSLIFFRFYQIVWYFSTFVLKNNIQTHAPDFPLPFPKGIYIFSPSDFEFIRKALVSHIKKQSLDFINLAQEITQVKAQWKLFHESLKEDLENFEHIQVSF